MNKNRQKLLKNYFLSLFYKWLFRFNVIRLTRKVNNYCIIYYFFGANISFQHLNELILQYYTTRLG